MFALRRKRWKMVKLSKIITQVRGVSYKSNDVILEKKAGYTCLLRANNIDRGELKFDDVVYVDSARVKNTQLLRAEDILICASSGSRHLVGKAACVIGDMNVTFGAFCKVIRPLAEYAPFLGWFFRSPRYRMQISNASAGVNINNIRAEDIDNMEIDLLTVKQREEAVRKLNAITRLISLRQRQAEKLDELVKARFVEMFGDPVRNTKQFPLVELQDLYDVSSSKRVYQDEMVLDGIPFLRISDIVEKSTNDKCTPQCFISQEMYDQLSKKGLTPNVGDILVTSRGTLGLCYEVKPGEKFYFQDGMISWLYNRKDCVINTYLLYAFRMPGIRKQIDGSNDGSTVSYLSIARLKRLKIELPPLALQTEFSHFVHEADREKERIQRSAALLATLKRSLMQQYFG